MTTSLACNRAANHHGGEARMADIFISYTSSDCDWAFWIAHELEALGHVPHVHEWEIKTGGNIIAWMEERHHAADHILCVVSKAYLAAPYSSLERQAAQWAAASNRPNFALPVFVEACEPPTLFAPLKRCDLYGLSEEDARARLRTLVPTVFPRGATTKQIPARPPAPFPGKAAASSTLSNIPISVPRHFVGRDGALEAIRKALAEKQVPVAITALHGLRGVGKTTLAAAYAERHRGEYRATWWIRAQTESTMRADLVALGVRLGWVAPDEKEDPAIATVMDRLRDEGVGILLIFDNAIDADGLNAYLPSRGATQILVTSNAPTWGAVAAPIGISVWRKEVGADYLIARLGRAGERAAAEALSNTLGGLPLAHEQAAAYCERVGISLTDYRARFNAAPVRMLDSERDASRGYHDRLTVAKTFALAIDEAAKLHPAAEPLIVHAALLAPEPIPLFLLAEARDEFGEPLTSALAGDGLDEAVAALRTFALVERETIADERDASIATDCIRLHRLVRQVTQSQQDSNAKNAIRRTLIRAVAAIYPSEVFDKPLTWPRARRLDAIALALVDVEPALLEGAEEPASAVLSYLDEYRHAALAAYAEARRLGERALAINERIFGAEDDRTATGLNNLALLLRDQGEHAAARQLFERSLAICEKIHGSDDPKTALTLNNLALVLQDQGDPAGARSLFERALVIREQLLGPKHADTAASLLTLGGLLRDQGDLAGARSLCERALAIFENVLGPEHPLTAHSLAQLGRVLTKQGDHTKAQALFERDLRMTEKVLGPEHPDTAASLGNLAMVLQAQGDFLGARSLKERALVIYEKVLGPDHLGTAGGLNNLGTLLKDQGDPTAARPLLERALKICEKVLGPEHPETQFVRRNLAACS